MDAVEDAVEAAQEERKKENLNRVKNAAKQCVNAAAKDAAKFNIFYTLEKILIIYIVCPKTLSEEQKEQLKNIL